MAKKGKLLEDALIFAVVVALVFAGLYLYNLLAPKPLYQEGIMGTMATQLDLIVKNLEIFQTDPSLENYLILKMAVSRAYGITLPAYAAYQKNNPRLSEKWQNLGIFLNQIELELKNGLLKVGSADQALKDLADRLKDLNEPLVKLSEKFRDWSQETTSEEKASLFWSQLEECEKAIAALIP